ncbi:MAG: hypothetical protein LC734_09230, partial [Acidobacteria bacterium]|nr:hypothetical protein [Acidobacteriota bacterium]
KFKRDYRNTNFNFRAYTTIDTQLQHMAETAIAKHYARLNAADRKNGKRMQAALVAMDPKTGHVLAMVGGRDYAESQFNRATAAYRQPGSTFKPFVYATALESGYSPVSTVADKPTEFMTIGAKPYSPENYGSSYAMMNITLKTALAKSSNVAAVQTALNAGVERVAAKARRFGFTRVNEYPSMALGTMDTTPLELAVAYSAFANGGENFFTPQGMTAAVVDPTTGMLADSHCPMSEKVLMRASTVTNIKCLVHEPRDPYLIAANHLPEFQTQSMTDVPRPDDTGPVETKIVPTESYLDEAEKRIEIRSPRRKTSEKIPLKLSSYQPGSGEAAVFLEDGGF